MSEPKHGDWRDCPDCKGSPHKQRFVGGTRQWVHHANFEWSEAKHGTQVLKPDPASRPPQRRSGVRERETTD